LSRILSLLLHPLMCYTHTDQ